MAVKCGGTLFVVVATSIFAIAMANKDWSTVAGNWNPWNHTGSDLWGYPHKNCSERSSRIVVGGSENWHYGFNYTDWAMKNGPFYLNDTLVFKYAPPNESTFPHSVYLLPDFWSFQNCDLKRARKIGEVTSGGGQGFEFVLKRWQPYYFACGEHKGIHCKDDLMKFAVWPLIRWYH